MRIALFAGFLGVLSTAVPLAAQNAVPSSTRPIRLLPCSHWTEGELRRNATSAELRCRFGVDGAGRFGLLSYAEVPVYQPQTPLPGTHVVGVPGMPKPRPGESWEGWEWRVHHTVFGPEVRQAQRGLDLLHPIFAGRLLTLERLLVENRVRAFRRETWRSPDRQAWLFQQGRSRPGPFATTTLTSWHSAVDARGVPTARAADYDVPAAHLVRFHELARRAGLDGYGADSNDPGHVFLPASEEVPPVVLSLLRVLPRVPHVTLATGRPADESITSAERSAWSARIHGWLAEPMGAVGPRLEMAGVQALWVRWTERAEAKLARQSRPTTPVAAPKRRRVG